jgi:ethanolamine ammonia-lyase small subunit
MREVKQMVSEAQLKRIVEQVLEEMGSINRPEQINKHEEAYTDTYTQDDSGLEDIAETDLSRQVFVPDSEKAQALLKMKEKTPARIGVWRAGPRYKTETMIRFRADHAAAQDAVFTDVSDGFLKKANLISIKTKCKDKDQYLTRPDLGRVIDDDGVQILRNKCARAPQVQIYVSDGLSSTAVEANAAEALPVIIQGLKNNGISVGTPFFLKYGRVPAMDQVSEILESEVTCVLIGERPGLITAESMSAYIAYRAKVGMPEANRNLVSNIHKGGTPAVEAGAHIVDLIKLMLNKKTSGLNLRF